MKAKKKASTLKFDEPNKNRMRGEEEPQKRVIGANSGMEARSGPPVQKDQVSPGSEPMAADLEQEKGDEVKEPRFEDFAKYKDLAMREQYPNLTPQYREWAEDTATEVDFDDLFMGEVRQSVQLNKKSNMTVEFRTLLQKDMLDLQDQAGPPMLTDNETNLKFYAYRLCIAVYRFGDVLMPPYRNKDGEWDEDLFNKRLRVFDDLPFMSIQFVDIHRRWFMERIGAIYGDKNAEQLKNG
jgi:hypothetical protein